MKYLKWIPNNIIDSVIILRDMKQSGAPIEYIAQLEEQVQISTRQSVELLFDRISEFVGCSNCKLNLNGENLRSDEVKLILSNI